MYSDQPTIPSSVVILRNELTRQPASQCRSSTLTIFIGILLDNALQVIRRPPIVPGCYPLRGRRQGRVFRVRRYVRWYGVGILYMVKGDQAERNGRPPTAS